MLFLDVFDVTDDISLIIETEVLVLPIFSVVLLTSLTMLDVIESLDIEVEEGVFSTKKVVPEATLHLSSLQVTNNGHQVVY